MPGQLFRLFYFQNIPNFNKFIDYFFRYITSFINLTVLGTSG